MILYTERNVGSEEIIVGVSDVLSKYCENCSGKILWEQTPHAYQQRRYVVDEDELVIYRLWYQPRLNSASGLTSLSTPEKHAYSNPSNTPPIPLPPPATPLNSPHHHHTLV